MRALRCDVLRCASASPLKTAANHHTFPSRSRSQQTEQGQEYAVHLSPEDTVGSVKHKLEQQTQVGGAAGGEERTLSPKRQPQRGTLAA